ncbi:MAG: hypothetical protein JO322_16020 [Candidatus Eremiobacteraeota bacterium]|nr:hypothetical protein [Candidatus Eremiobacteraeota bacterium]
MKKVLAYLAAAVPLVSAAFLARTFAPAPLPKPKPYDGPIPRSAPPPSVGVFALVTGVNHRVAAYAYRGGSFFDRRDFSMAAVLVRHPRGDLLIDTGFGRNIDAQCATLPFLFRAITIYDLWRPAVDRVTHPAAW